MAALLPDYAKTLELWGGVECTCNRVGERYFDQIARSGHANRPADLQLLADLGIRTLRYPALWEWSESTLDSGYSWRWPEERLPLLERCNINPIIGLVHHGSGPRYTNLLDDSFATGLAKYAQAFAARYPAVRDYTPVNEPLTTARFSALYGHWYPHRCSSYDFARALLNQCRATVLSMQRIREIRPEARLIQTEDVGPTFGSTYLQTQVEFDNARRWMTFDLLCGLVGPGHPIGEYFRWLGIEERELAWFQENPCPPDLLGLNYYVTSERYLDGRTELYPEQLWGGNGRDTYVDLEAVRIRPEGLAGIGNLLSETWNRYHRPMAVTEVQLGCTREEQARWFVEIWQQATSANKAGIDVRAVTAWSLLGSYDWDSLVTRETTSYEVGAFDIRSGQPRPTALARVIRDMAQQGSSEFPPLNQAGWWSLPLRLLENLEAPVSALKLKGQPLLLTEGTSRFAQIILAECSLRSLPCRIVKRKRKAKSIRAAISRAIQLYQPWAIIDTAAMQWLESISAQKNHSTPFANKDPREMIASIAREYTLPLLSFTSAIVFAPRSMPYQEHELHNATTFLGQSIGASDLRLLSNPHLLLLRLGEPCYDMADIVVMKTTRSLADELSDCQGIYSHIPEVARTALELIQDKACGLWHVVNISTAADVETKYDGIPRLSRLMTERGQLLSPFKLVSVKTLPTELEPEMV